MVGKEYLRNKFLLLQFYYKASLTTSFTASGNKRFKSLVDGIVTVQMRGSCSGCPSSTLTLKAGIEALLKRLLPDAVKEVVSEAL